MGEGVGLEWSGASGLGVGGDLVAAMQSEDPPLDRALPHWEADCILGFCVCGVGSWQRNQVG